MKQITHEVVTSLRIVNSLVMRDQTFACLDLVLTKLTERIGVIGGGLPTPYSKTSANGRLWLHLLASPD